MGSFWPFLAKRSSGTCPRRDSESIRLAFGEKSFSPKKVSRASPKTGPGAQTVGGESAQEVPGQFWEKVFLGFWGAGLTDLDIRTLEMPNVQMPNLEMPNSVM